MFPEMKCRIGQDAAYIRCAVSSDIQGIKDNFNFTEIKNAAQRLILLDVLEFFGLRIFNYCVL